MHPTATVKNWARFQHYKDRSPPWIKLHRELLDDFDFSRLHIASKALAPLLWLLAAESPDGRVIVDPEWLAFRLRWPVEDVVTGLSGLFQRGMLIGASTVLAECYPSACLETETEGETEGEKDTDAIASVSADESADDPDDDHQDPKGPPICPHEEIIALYHEILPELARVRIWDEGRQRLLRSRWREEPKRQNLEWWRKFFQYVKRCDFLLGKVDQTHRDPFFADLEWLIRPTNIRKVIEGKYQRVAA